MGDRISERSGSNRVSFVEQTEFDSPPVSQRCPPSPPPPLLDSPTFQRRGSNGSGRNSPILQSAHLRGNLLRQQRGRDPLFYYEVVKTLGVGSMGSVAKVRKRDHVVGGSARKVVQDAFRRQKRQEECLKLPVIGCLFRACINGDAAKTLHKKTSSILSNSSILRPLGDLFESNRSKNSDDQNASTASLRSNSDDNVYAMKSIHLSRVTDEMFVIELKNEIEIFKQLDHPHIVRAIETFELRNQIFIVMELCRGGDLYSRDPYTEEQAARIVTSILSAVAYMHSKNIAHRDLKYENILFVNESPHAEVKLIDFGLSKVYGDNVQLTEGVGTIYTMAPEVLKGNYTQTADIWSIGVIAYMLLSSQMPFYGRKRRHIVEQILNCEFDFRGRRWKRISAQAKAFVEDLLVLDPEDRIPAEDALRSTWLNRRFAATTRAPLAEEENTARLAMLKYAGYTKLKKMALMVVAHKSSTEEIGILRKVFQKYDSRKDGCIGFEEFSDALKESGQSKEDLREMFEAVDLDGSGRIRYTEFLAATIEAQGAISEERLAEAFDRLDSDDSGYISAENLAELLGQDFCREEIDEILKEASLTHDNRVSYAEFLSLWETKQESTRELALRSLGNEALRESFDMGLGSSHSSSDLTALQDTAEARASFIHEKHCALDRSSSRHVDFTDTVLTIPADDDLGMPIEGDTVESLSIPS